MTLAHFPGPSGAPHLLFYGHYDVQPPEPLDLWTSPPFEPLLVDGPHGKRIVARGAVDDKGQTMLWLEAFRAYRALAGGLPVGVTVLVEGEEEIGSPRLPAFLDAHRKELQADVAVIADTGMWDIATPAITTRLRGSTYVEVKLRVAARDLHSGLFGGSAQNAANILAKALGQLHDQEGRIQIPGFYDGVKPLSRELLASWEALNFDEAAFLGRMGLRTPAGEKGSIRPRSALGPSDRRYHRHVERLHRPWRQDRHSGRGECKSLFPPRAGARPGRCRGSISAVHPRAAAA